MGYMNLDWNSYGFFEWFDLALLAIHPHPNEKLHHQLTHRAESSPNTFVDVCGSWMVGQKGFKTSIFPTADEATCDFVYYHGFQSKKTYKNTKVPLLPLHRFVLCCPEKHVFPNSMGHGDVMTGEPRKRTCILQKRPCFKAGDTFYKPSIRFISGITCQISRVYILLVVANFPELLNMCSSSTREFSFSKRKKHNI